MNTRPVRLSIGLPVYNGERYIRFALDSILQQTFQDFEVIISDNASTDSTMVICQEYAAKDSRVRYYRNQENIGAARNFNKTFQLARGDYFKWAAADDMISPSFLERCVQILDQDPSVILCYSKVNRIDALGEIDGTYDYPMRVDHPSPLVRFSDLILTNHFCIAVFGVIRRQTLARTPLIGKYVGSDRVLLAELSLYGRLIEIPEYLFHRRDHPQTSGRMFTIYNRLSWFDPRKKQQINLVNWNVGVQYAKTIKRGPIPWKQKIAFYSTIVHWFIHRRVVLFEDIKAAVLQLLPFFGNIINFAKRNPAKE
jgi:glycosyltransferase involved in cell wall biosynthesis